MEVLTVEINDERAICFLKDLEALNVLKIIHRNSKLKYRSNISERLAGSISSEQALVMHQELEQMRGEWERNI
ncbi:MAG: hypothetical protein LBR10_01510 [Prevotellaceae bacterium]|jgi:hypothetical protein|nr:hypothetical protein [Prevotellaceae bacterium]